MSNRKEHDALVDACREQGWDVTQTTQGHWRCAPPDKTKQVVHIGGRSAGDPRAIKNSIAELRRSGLIWPPEPPPREAVQSLLVGNMNLRGPYVSSPVKEPVEALSTTEEAYKKEWEKASGGVLKEDLPETEEAIDRAFRDLKDAKILHQIAADHARDLESELGKVKRALEEARKEEHSAAVALAAMKGNFDRLFASDEAAA